jgi:hypothetical protein
VVGLVDFMPFIGKREDGRYAFFVMILFLGSKNIIVFPSIGSAPETH